MPVISFSFFKPILERVKGIDNRILGCAVAVFSIAHMTGAVLNAGRVARLSLHGIASLCLFIFSKNISFVMINKLDDHKFEIVLDYKNPQYIRFSKEFLAEKLDIDLKYYDLDISYISRYSAGTGLTTEEGLEIKKGFHSVLTDKPSIINLKVRQKNASH
jgi:hypothetical protein